MMNMDIVLNQGNWEKLKNKLGKKYPQLIITDTQYKEDLKNMLQMIDYKLRKLQKTKQEIRVIIAGL
jgi:mevalonate kinase